MNKIEIPLSRTKLLFTVAASILFVILGIYIITTISAHQTQVNPLVLKGIGIANILFFGVIGMYGIKKMFDTNVGLTIDDNGITDNTSATSIGLIEWSDITDITTKQIMSSKFLLIFTKDPNASLEKASGLKRKLMYANMKMYGTPIAITSTTLQYDFNALEKLLKNRLNEQRERMPNS